jgi:hypothetical protein
MGDSIIYTEQQFQGRWSVKQLSLSYAYLNSVIKVNVKLPLCLPLRHMEGCLHAFVTSPLDGDDWSGSHPHFFLWGGNPCYHFNKRLGRHQSFLVEDNLLPFLGIDPQLLGDPS